jgi:hypothetical protein
LQSVSPAAQVVPQVPFEHVATLPPELVHELVHEPQKRGSVVRSTQMPLQFVRGGLHVAAHPVGVHTWLAVHTTPQPPQLPNVRRLVSQPLEAIPSQSA